MLKPACCFFLKKNISYNIKILLLPLMSPLSENPGPIAAAGINGRNLHCLQKQSKDTSVLNSKSTSLTPGCATAVDAKNLP